MKNTDALKRVTEQEFIGMFGEQYYAALAMQCSQMITKSAEFKRPDPTCYGLHAFDSPCGEFSSIVVLMDVSKHFRMGKMVVGDFGFRRLYLTNAVGRELESLLLTLTNEYFEDFDGSLVRGGDWDNQIKFRKT